MDEPTNNPTADTSTPTPTPTPTPEPPTAPPPVNENAPEPKIIIPKWVVALIFLITLILIGGSVVAYLRYTNKTFPRIPYNNPEAGKTIPTSPTVRPIMWKMYTNDKYNFTVQYPDHGLDMNGNIVDCGTHVTESPADSLNTYIDQYIFDSAFTITIIQTNQSLTDYLQTAEKADQKEHPQLQYADLYVLTPIEGSGADEAIMITPKEGADRSITDAGARGLGGVGALYKKVNTMFVVGRLPDNRGPDMCTPPAGSKSRLPSEFSSWDVPKSIHFH